MSCSLALTIVTSDYHAPRAKLIFEFVFGDKHHVCVYGACRETFDDQSQKEIQSLAAFENTFSDAKKGDIDSIYTALMGKHPYYNGNVEPRIEMSELFGIWVPRHLGF